MYYDVNISAYNCYSIAGYAMKWNKWHSPVPSTFLGRNKNLWNTCNRSRYTHPMHAASMYFTLEMLDTMAFLQEPNHLYKKAWKINRHTILAFRQPYIVLELTETANVTGSRIF